MQRDALPPAPPVPAPPPVSPPDWPPVAEPALAEPLEPPVSEPLAPPLLVPSDVVSPQEVHDEISTALRNRRTCAMPCDTQGACRAHTHAIALFCEEIRAAPARSGTTSAIAASVLAIRDESGRVATRRIGARHAQGAGAIEEARRHASAASRARRITDSSGSERRISAARRAAKWLGRARGQQHEADACELRDRRNGSAVHALDPIIRSDDGLDAEQNAPHPSRSASRKYKSEPWPTRPIWPCSLL